jgi:hypothetical protein
MIWIFATAVLLLIVYNAAFRRFAMWAGGSLAVATLILCGAVAYKEHKTFDPSTAVLDPSQVTWGDAPAAAGVVPDSDLPDNLKDHTHTQR